MKKTVWLLSFLSIALTFTATAQLSAPAGVHFLKPKNNAADAYRQRIAQTANRLANTAITIDYATSNGDDMALASFLNMHFSMPADSFGERYAVVAYDSLHDQPSNTGYAYSDFDSIKVDSVVFFFGHENNDGLSDTLIVKVVELNAAGYPTNTVLWSQTFTSGANSFTGVNDWSMIAGVTVAPDITFPSSKKFGFRMEYYGAKTDTFAYLFSFVDLGACPNYGISYSADLSEFWPTSYRFDVFNNLLLPTATMQDVFWDCDGNGSGERANPIQNINVIAYITGVEAALPPGPKVRLLRVDPVADEVTIKNFGDAAQNISTYTFCSNFLYTSNLTSQTLLAGSLNLNPGDTAKLGLTSLSLAEAGGDLGLYMNAFNFADPANMVDFTQWKTAGNGREPEAVSKGIWGTGDFVTGAAPYSYIGDGYEDGVDFWMGSLAPITECDTITNIFVTDSARLYLASGGGYISGHNSFDDISKADSFYVDGIAEVTDAVLFFGDAQYASPSSFIIVAVWDNDGSTGAPGAMLASDTVYIIDIANAIAATPPIAPIFVQFSSPPTVSGVFYVGITFTYAAGDTVGLITNHVGNGNPNTAWEQWADNTWHTYEDSWPSGPLSHFIFTSICPPGSCPSITVNTTFTNAICSSANGTATATAIGGTGPYTYNWNQLQVGSSISGLAAGTYTVTAEDANGCTGTGSVTVGLTNTTLTVNVTDTDNTSCGAPNGTATANASGGTAPYTYTWSGGLGTNDSIFNLAAGSYTVSAYDANGCSGTNSVTVASAPPTITVSAAASTPNTQCTNPNGSATATATGGTAPYTYTWPASAGNQVGATANNLAGGNYTVTANDNAGCTGTGIITVGTTTPTITVSVTNSTPSTSCAAPDGSATVSATGGTGPYTYLWPASAGNQTNATAINLAGGTYTVTATDNAGCTGTGDVTVNATTPVITVSVTNSTGNTSCINPNGSGTVNATGGTGPYTYNWTGGGTGATVSGLAEGSYTVTATDVNSCTGQGTVTIANNKPVLNVSIATSPVTSCVNNNGSATATTTGATGVTYVWSTSPAQTSPTASNLAAGNYTVTATDPTSGCTATASATVGTNTPAVSVSITATNHITNCANANGSATATGAGGLGGFTYVWSTVPAQNNATASNLAAGSYTVTATSTNGCTASATATINDSTKTVNVDINTTPVSSCSTPNGSAVAVASGGTNPYTYAWADGPTTSTRNGLAAGSYSVTVTDANGCQGSDNGTVGTTTPNPPTVTVTVTDETSPTADDGTATATASGGTAPYNYAWNTTPAQTDDTAVDLDNGTYTVTVTDAAGCTATASALIGTVGIKLPADISLLSIYPNPTTDVVNVQIELKEAKDVKIEWFNMLGETVIVREFDAVQALAEKFSLNALPEGIYMTRITVGDDTVTSRVSVVH